MRKRKLNAFNDAPLINDLTYIDFLRRFKQIALSIFEWENLPAGLDARFLEQSLYYDGIASFLYDKEKGYMNLRASVSGDLNYYGLPTKLNCWSYNMQKIRNVYYGLNELNIRPKEQECILVMNSWEGEGTAATMELFAMRLYEAERASDVNIKQQKFPALITTDENQRLTLENLYKKVDGNTPVIFGDSKLNEVSKVKAFNTQAPYVADKLQDYKKEIFNEALQFLGINSLNEKKERLINQEASSNNEVTNLNLQSHFAPRQEACRLFNEKYGENISVKIRSDLYNIIKEQESIINDYDFNDEATTDLGLGDE